MTYITATVILPKNRDYPSSVLTELERAAGNVLKTKVKSRLVFLLGLRVANWHKKPLFVGRYRRPSHDTFELLVYPSAATGKIYRWVTGGTRPYTIKTRNAPYLRWRRYHPKTARGNRYGGPGTYYGKYYRSQSVRHTGIAARHFETQVVNHHAREIVQMIRADLLAAVRR